MEDDRYSLGEVETLLRNYPHLRSYLFGCAAQTTTDAQGVAAPPPLRGPQPLGMQRGDTPWPFMEPRRASRIRDGKKAAIRQTDLHATVLDLEEALNRLSADDFALCFAYYIAGYTLAECLPLFGLSSEGSLSVRMKNIVRRIMRTLNGEPQF